MESYKPLAWGKPSLLLLLLACCLPVTARANSSWVWIAETRPGDILPFVILGTLGFETAVLLLLAWPRRKGRAFGVVCLGNLLSFLLPYVLRFLGAGPVSGLGDFYIVGVVFLAATLVVELPVEYFLLEKDSPKRERLVAAILLANLVSTGAVALVERSICRGYWV